MPEYPPLAHKAGVITRDPQEKETAKGDIVVFSMAVPQSYGENGNVFVDVAVFNEGLQEVAKGLIKGNKVVVEGSYKERNVDGKTYRDLIAFRIGTVDWFAKPGAEKPKTSKAKAKPVEDDDDI